MDQNLNQSSDKQVQQEVEQVIPKQKKPGRMAVQIFAIVVLLGLVGYGVYAWQNNRVTKLEDQVAALKKTDTASTGASATTSDQYKGWKSYTSTTEKATFKYPSAWSFSATTRKSGSDYDGADDATIMSPSGAIKVDWMSVVDGIGGGCDPESCPYVYPLGEEQLESAKDLKLSYGVISDNGKTYKVWMGVTSRSIEDDYRGLIFLVYDGKNNKSVNNLTKTNLGAAFTIGSISGVNKKEFASKQDAINYFNNSEMKQAKQILQSLSY